VTTVPVSDNKVQNLSLHITVYSVALLLNLAQLFLYIRYLSIKISDTNLNFMYITFHMGGGEETFCNVSQIHGRGVQLL